MNNQRAMGMAVGLLVCMLVSTVVIAAEPAPTPPTQNQQAEPRAERPDRGQRGEGQRGFDMEGMQQRMMERMKEQLVANDQEWKIIEPRLSKVMTLSRQTAGRFMGMMGRRGGGPGGFDRPGRTDSEQENPVQKAQQTLQQTLEDQNASTETIKSQVTALREAREKARQEMAQAQQDLREVLTVKQEAQLVMMGLLD